jgi:2-keto-4-pentenoate hydratase/2-oxohepta-3-ene-1,7-dioic acid hydratase in catechol pathway
MRIGVLTNQRIVALDNDDGAVDLEPVLGPSTDVVSLRLRRFLDRVDDVRRLVADGERIPAGFDFTAPSPAPRTVLAAPVNYAMHAGELGDKSPQSSDLDARRLGLIVLASASVVGPDGDIELPDQPGREFHYEGEIGVVIGKDAWNVPKENALDHVLGYTGLLDITMRLSDEGKEDRSMRKSFRTFTPIGPVILTADDVSDPTELSLELFLNGELKQSGNLGELIVDVAELVSRASNLVPLQTGDVIATGTPAGVGPIVAGDKLSLKVSGMGELRMSVVEGRGA